MLAESGALDGGVKHVAGIAWGDAGFLRLAGEVGPVRLSLGSGDACPRQAGGLSGFRFHGSALEVDLSGNINLEWLGGRRISSVGGAPDYMRGAAASPGGRSIIALSSTSRGGASRIVPRLEKASVPGDLADTIVTEHGVAELRGRSGHARAQALIAIAAPEHRAALSDQKL